MREVALRAARSGSGSDSTTIQERRERVAAVQVKAQRGVERAFDAVDADLAVSLGGVAISAGKEGAGIEDGEIEAGSGAEFTHVHVAAERAGWTGAEFSIGGGGDAHHSAKGAKGDYGGRERASFVRE